ncbi:hypothetical protein TWF281_007029 [Arthrobotrys megalospora]
MQASAEKRGSEPATATESATHTLLTLPVELQLQVLSHLSIGDQITAAKICPLWKDILLNEQLTKRSRYGYSAYSKKVCGHRLVVWATEKPAEKQMLPHFSFIVQNGILKSFLCLNGLPVDQSNIEGRRPNDTSPLLLSGDISDCIFLDEPILTPFVTNPPQPFTLSDGETPKPLLTRKQQQAIDGEKVGEVVHRKYSTYYYDTEDSAGEASAETESKGYRFTAFLNVTHSSTWSGDMWTATLNLRRETTVREAAEAIVKEVEPILRKWGIKTELPHEIFFAGHDESKSGWRLVAGFITDTDDSDYRY